MGNEHETYSPSEAPSRADEAEELVSGDETRRQKRKEYYRQWVEKKKATDPEWVERRRESARRYRNGFRAPPRIEITKEAREIWERFR